MLKAACLIIADYSSVRSTFCFVQNQNRRYAYYVTFYLYEYDETIYSADAPIEYCRQFCMVWIDEHLPVMCISYRFVILKSIK